MWKFQYSYKQMFWYRYNDSCIIVCIHGNTYKEEMPRDITMDEFFLRYICDDEIWIDEVK